VCELWGGGGVWRGLEREARVGSKAEAGAEVKAGSEAEASSTGEAADAKFKADQANAAMIELAQGPGGAAVARGAMGCSGEEMTSE